ncbi:uncharacterized protein ACN427_008305 [Glossina fuscipes fuscipes]
METCRTCAKCDFDNESQWMDLFNPQYRQTEIESIRIEFNIWKLKISPNDGLPQKICHDCFNKFLTISSFRLQCSEAQVKLNNIFDKIDNQSIKDDENFDNFTTERENNECTVNTTAVGVIVHQSTRIKNHTEIKTNENNAKNTISANVSKKTIKTYTTRTAVIKTHNQNSSEIINNNNSNSNNNIIIPTIFVNNANNRKSVHIDDTNDLSDNGIIEEFHDAVKSVNWNTNESKNYTNNVNSNNDKKKKSSSSHHNENDLTNDNISITFECKYCYKSRHRPVEMFHTQRDLLTHITVYHNSENPYNCPFCEMGFQDAASRTMHLKDQHCQKMFTCETCGKKYADRFNLRNHIEKYHTEIDYDCTLCQKSFLSRKSLNYHMKWHKPEYQLKCTYCERLFINQRHLKCHEETHTGLRNQEVCSFCGKCFIHLKTLRWHIYRQHDGEKPYKCGNCSEVFASYAKKRLHMLDYHLDNLTVLEKTECMLCHKRYENEIDLKKHMLEDHNEEKCTIKISNNKRVIMNKKQKQFSGLFQCEVCDKRFNMKSALERHQAVHSIEGRPHACPQCPKRFKRSQDMNWHLKTHSEEKPNICDVCGKGFALKYVLTQHRRSHEVLEKNFSCTICGRSYLFEKSLRLHERIHTGKTYYKCDLCNANFVTHIKFKWHMSKMHDAEEISATANINFNTNYEKGLPLDDLVNFVIP